MGCYTTEGDVTDDVIDPVSKKSKHLFVPPMQYMNQVQNIQGSDGVNRYSIEHELGVSLTLVLFQPSSR